GFDERFDRLFEASAPTSGIVGVRDARYLNWRYRDNPLYESHVLMSEQGGRLQGYLVFTESGGMLNVKDVFPPGNSSSVRDLIAEAIRLGYRRRVASISFTALEGNPVLPLFEEFGFRLRQDGSQMFAYAPAASPIREMITRAESWYLTVGDRDV
ncbi:MAG: hypothetical protein WD005_00965, partial [Haliea sp.]